jgi:hypothetical protein
MTVSFALATVKSFAEAPTIRDWPDMIIGDIESVTQSVTAGNVFVFATNYARGDVIDTREQFIADDNVNSVTVKWSFFQLSGNDILINGVPSLDGLGGALGSTSDPIQPAVTRQITANNTDPGDTQSPLPNQVEDGNEFTMTFRDATLSPIGGPNVDPPGSGLVNTSVLTIIASDNTITSTVEMIVQTVDGGTDSLTEGISLDPLDTFDFSLGALNWTSAVLTGATAAQNGSGLCVTVNGPGGASLGLWNSPAFNVDPPVELVNGKAYRARFDLSSSQSNPDAIPIVILAYSSLAWGGNAFWIDVLGGANGIDRPQGIDVADVWFTPVPVRIPAWQTGAFQPAEDAQNDAQLQFVVPNVNANIVFSADSGTICLASLSIASGDVSSLGSGTPVLGPVTPTDAVFDALVLVDSTLAADNALPDQAGFVAAGARFAVAPVSGNTAASNAALRAAGVGVLTFGATSATSLSDTNPLPWNSDVLLDAQITVESESGGTDPVDATAITFLAATSETGGQMYVTSGAPGGVFDQMGSPVVGSGSVLTGLFFTSNVTLDPDFEPTVGSNTDSSADSIALIFSAVNRDDLAGDATGADPILVTDITVTENQVQP